MPCATTGDRANPYTDTTGGFRCLSGEKLDENHILVDFRAVREATEEVMRYLDHKHLNELPPFDQELNPSTENIAAFVFHQVANRINTPHYQVTLVRAWETPTTMAAYGLA